MTVNADADVIQDTGDNNTVTFLATLASYMLSRSGVTISVKSIATGITDLLTGVQTLAFTDQSVQASTVVAPQPPTIVARAADVVEKGQTTVIGTVAPGAAGDSLVLTQTSGAGAVSLGTIQSDGTRQIIYTAPAAVAASAQDSVGYTVTEATGKTNGSATVQLDAGPGIALVPFVRSAPGTTVTIATALPGLPSDTETLVITKAPANGTVTLQGNAIQFTPSSANASPTTFAVGLRDQLGGTTPVRTFIIGGNSPSTITGDATGNTNVSVGTALNRITLGGSGNIVDAAGGTTVVTGGVSGNTVVAGAGQASLSFTGGNNTITLGTGTASVNVGGTGNAITLGNGVAVVHGGTGDTINLASTALSVYGTNGMVFLGASKASVSDFSAGLMVKVGPAAALDTLTGFGYSRGGVVDLLGGVGGYRDTASVVSALRSDGHGGTLLSFGSSSSLDFAALAPSQLQASNFQIG